MTKTEKIISDVENAWGFVEIWPTCVMIETLKACIEIIRKENKNGK